MNTGKGKGKKHLSFGVHRVIQTYTQTDRRIAGINVKHGHTGEVHRGGRQRDIFWVRSFDQGLCVLALVSDSKNQDLY